MVAPFVREEYCLNSVSITACGLAIAIPLMILVANVNIRIAKMEDLVGAGLGRFMAAFRDGLSKASPAEQRVSAGPTVDPMAVQSKLE